MTTKRWIVYGVAGTLGLGVLAGAAVATATAMELRTDDGTVLDGGAVEVAHRGGGDRTPAPGAGPVSPTAPGGVPLPAKPNTGIASAASPADAPVQSVAPVPAVEPAPPVAVSAVSAVSAASAASVPSAASSD